MDTEELTEALIERFTDELDSKTMDANIPPDEAARIYRAVARAIFERATILDDEA